MQIPQPLPPRSVELETDEPAALGAAQPERGRQYVQLGAGPFHGLVSERSDGVVAFARERWGAAVRVRCARARTYVAFSCVHAAAPATWCGIPLDRESVLELDRDWEISTRGPLQARSFAVARSALERVEAALARGEEPIAAENRILEGEGATVDRLGECVASAIAAVDRSNAAWRALHDDFLHLAARLRRPSDVGKARIEPWSSRRAAVRRVEEFLDAHERELPSLADLCALTGVSERTLEYAFREQVGMPPGRYLRMRRLNRARRELQALDPDGTRVTDIAFTWGFWQLGRFAAEYRALFGERPSETLARGAVASVIPSIALTLQSVDRSLGQPESP